MPAADGCRGSRTSASRTWRDDASIARMGRRTREGGLVGTPAYLCPEQIRGRSKPTAQWDVFSLGVVLYELATGGTHPFERGDDDATMTAIEEGDLAPVHEVHPGIDPVLREAIEGALATRPSDSTGELCGVRLGADAAAGRSRDGGAGAGPRPGGGRTSTGAAGAVGRPWRGPGVAAAERGRGGGQRSGAGASHSAVRRVRRRAPAHQLPRRPVGASEPQRRRHPRQRRQGDAHRPAGR